MLRFLFRLLATVALAISVTMAVLDVTRTIAASSLVLTPLITSWITVSPDTLSAVQTFVVTKLHPLVWDPLIVALLNRPGFVVFALLALLLYAVGHRPERRIGRFASQR
jgi:hypothetical protein